MSTTPAKDAVRLNTDQHCYVIPQGDGYSCLGFNNARDHANQIAELMARPDLAFTSDDYATLAGYHRYNTALAAWGQSSHSRRTYFDPGTDPKVRRILEAYRSTGAKLRLILGDTDTGEAWLDEHDVVGSIGRSSGWLKVPLLIQPGEHGGSAVLTASILSIVDWNSGSVVYRHPAYRLPNLLIQPTGDKSRPWQVVHHGVDVASFDDIGRAGAYVAFMRGATIEPRVFR